MDNSEMKVLRWGIPGWVTILTYFVLTMSIKKYDFTSIYSGHDTDGGLLAGSTAILAALGIPLGYIIYQIYFFIKWKWFMKSSEIDKLMKGLKLYNDLSVKRDMNSLDSWKKAERTFNIYLSAFLTETTLNYDDIMRQYRSFQSRTDRVHGLGASFTGIVLAIALFFFYQFTSNGSEVFRNCSFGMTIIFIGVIALIFLSNYRRANIDSFQQMRGIMVDIEVACELMKKK